MFGFEWIASPEAWIALLTLTALEIVLGIDNIVFISILANKLPEDQRDRGEDEKERQVHGDVGRTGARRRDGLQGLIHVEDRIQLGRLPQETGQHLGREERPPEHQQGHPEGGHRPVDVFRAAREMGPEEETEADERGHRILFVQAGPDQQDDGGAG